MDEHWTNRNLYRRINSVISNNSTKAIMLVSRWLVGQKQQGEMNAIR